MFICSSGLTGQPELYLAISGGSIDTKEINKFYKSDSTLPSQRAGCTPLSKPLKESLKCTGCKKKCTKSNNDQNKGEVKWKLLSHVQLFATLWTLGSLPGPSVYEILQARILEWVAIPFSRGSSQPRDQTQIFLIAGGFFIWATREGA